MTEFTPGEGWRRFGGYQIIRFSRAQPETVAHRLLGSGEFSTGAGALALNGLTGWTGSAGTAPCRNDLNRRYDVGVVTARLASLLAIGLLSVPAWALDPRLALTQFGHDVWNTSNGLPHDSVRGIAQTADGYLWFATIDGLARFDGVNFTVFDGSNTPLLKRSAVIALLAAPDGSLWIGTGSNGLLRYRNGSFERIGGPGLPTT